MPKLFSSWDRPLRSTIREPIQERNQWRKLEPGQPMPFPAIPLVGITKIQNRLVTVIDWFLLRGYHDDRGEWRHAGYAFVVVECDGKQVKIKATSPMMIGKLKQATNSFQAMIYRGATGFIFEERDSRADIK